MGWQTEERVDWIIYGFVAGRSILDLVLALILYIQSDSLLIAGGLWLLCWIFYLYLVLGTWYETFPGKYGRKVIRWREPAAWWLVFVLLVLFHTTVTGLMVYQIS